MCAHVMCSRVEEPVAVRLSDWRTFVEDEVDNAGDQDKSRDGSCTDAAQQYSQLISWTKNDLSSKTRKIRGGRSNPSKTLVPLSHPKTATDLITTRRWIVQPRPSISCHNRDLSTTAPVQSLFCNLTKHHQWFWPGYPTIPTKITPGFFLWDFVLTLLCYWTRFCSYDDDDNNNDVFFFERASPFTTN